MTTKQAVKILRFHNRWRRGEEIPMQEPAKIGEAIEVLCDAVENLASQFTKLDKPKYSGDPMMDSVLSTRNPEFDEWVAGLPPNYWTRYDLSAARIGWEAAIKHNQSK